MVRTNTTVADVRVPVWCALCLEEVTCVVPSLCDYLCGIFSKQSACCCVSQEEDSEGIDRVHDAHSDRANFHSNCRQKLFSSPKRILAAMKCVEEGFRRAGLRKLAKYWQDRVSNYSIIRKTSSKKDALAYAYFNYSGTHGKTPKQVSDLTKEARRCGQAMRGEGGRGSSSDTSATSNSSPEKKRKHKSSKSKMVLQAPDRGYPYQQYGQRRRPFAGQYIPRPPPAPLAPRARAQTERSCYTCQETGHLAKDCKAPKIKKEA